MSTSMRFAWHGKVGWVLVLVSGCAGADNDPDLGLPAPNEAGLVLDASLATEAGSTLGRGPDGSLGAGAVPVVPLDATTADTHDAASDAASGQADAATASATDAHVGGASLASVCMGGTPGTDSTKQTAGAEYAAVKYQLALSNQIVRLQTTLHVPEKPKNRSTLFIWPGLQWLRGKDPARLGNGILQPVLTWGASCAPGTRIGYNSWWVSGMYVNVSTSAAGPTGCAGGEVMDVAVGDALRMDMNLAGSTWTQTIADQQTGKSVDFSIDLKGQYQNWATWAVEQPASAVPPEDVVYTDSVLTFAEKVSSCQMSQRGPSDYYSAPVLSPDGLHCCYSKIILRSKGVAATSPNGP